MLFHEQLDAVYTIGHLWNLTDMYCKKLTNSLFALIKNEPKI